MRSDYFVAFDSRQPGCWGFYLRTHSANMNARCANKNEEDSWAHYLRDIENTTSLPDEKVNQFLDEQRRKRQEKSNMGFS